MIMMLIKIVITMRVLLQMRITVIDADVTITAMKTVVRIITLHDDNNINFGRYNKKVMSGSSNHDKDTK